MANRHHRRGGRTTPKGTRPRSHSTHGAPERPPFLDEIEAKLRERSPYSLMAFASTVMEASTARPLDRWRGEPERPDPAPVYLSFAQSGWPEMGAFAMAIAAMHPDDVLSARLRAAVHPRDLSFLPRWVGSMEQIEINSTTVMTDVLGDGENLTISWNWPDGAECTAFVYVDHNMGTLVKDAFVVPMSLDEVVADAQRLSGDTPPREAIDAADLRARATEAIERGDHTIPPFETDWWPSCRPMVEWVLRHLPLGGQGYERPEWLDDDRDRLLDEFVSSAFAEVDGLTRDDVRELTDPLIWFGCDYGPGDPLRWSPASVEIVLVDWYPRKVLGLGNIQKRLPDVLAAFVRYCHERTRITAELTAETVESIERWRGEYLRAVNQPGRSRDSNAANLARIAAGFIGGTLDALVDDDDVIDIDDDVELDDDEYMATTVQVLEASLIDVVGSRDAYDSLTDEPLADRPFDWSRVPAKVHEQVANTLAQLDEWAADLYDDEVRTIARAVLEAVAEDDPGAFERSPRTDTLAAGVLGFVTTRVTARYPARDRRDLQWKVRSRKELAAAAGVSMSAIHGRIITITNAVDRTEFEWSSFLHSAQRRDVLASKQFIEEWRREHG